MPTPAHTDFDNVNPQSSQTPAAFATSNMADLKALRDAILSGRIEGFVQTRTNGTGTANQPQFVTWLNAALRSGSAGISPGRASSRRPSPTSGATTTARAGPPSTRARRR
jgi:hypothetical protein